MKKINDMNLKSKKYFYNQDRYNLANLEKMFKIAKTNYFDRVKKKKI